MRGWFGVAAGLGWGLLPVFAGVWGAAVAMGLLLFIGRPGGLRRPALLVFIHKGLLFLRVRIGAECD